MNKRLTCVALLLMAAAGVSPGFSQDPPPASGKGQDAKQPAENAIRRKLAEKGAFDFAETPLTEVLQYLQEKHGLNVLLDKKTVEEEGIDVSTPVTIKIQGVTLQSALRLILEPLELSAINKHELLLVTTKSKAQGEVERRVYGVRDLVASAAEPEEEIDPAAYQRLVELVSAIVAPASWQPLGGNGSIKPLRGMLIVAQTGAVHEEIESLLAELRQVRRGKQPEAAEVEDAIDQALAAKTSIQFADTPFTEAAAFLADKHKLQIVIDRKALADDGVDVDSPVTQRLSNVSLRTALTSILEPLGLTHLKRNEVLRITTRAAAAPDLERKIYDVRDLEPADRDSIDQDKSTSVADIVSSTVAAPSWSQNGGLGVLVSLDGLLVVLQTQEHHREIKLLLAELRRVERQQAPVKTGEKPADKAAAEEIGETVPALIAKLKDTNQDRKTRDGAAESLGKIGEPAVAPLIDLLENTSAEVRFRAAVALGNMGPKARPALAALHAAKSRETDSGVEFYLTSAIKKIDK